MGKKRELQRRGKITARLIQLLWRERDRGNLPEGSKATVANPPGTKNNR